ncbi:MAG: D-alanyl-D-alanine carboxypeptidase [Alphaproteobacteria bacterium]
MTVGTDFPNFVGKRVCGMWFRRGAGLVTVTDWAWRLATRAVLILVLSAGGVLLSIEGTGGVALANSKYASIVMDELTGEVLYSRSADLLRHPASLTKVMTLYLLFEEVTAQRLKLTDSFKASKRAAGQPPSKLGIRAGQRIKVRDAIKALVVRSANDVAVVVAENIAGTERKFAQRMNKRAKALGMKKTRFRNASGLPNRSQVTTARDMAILCQRIRKDFPQFMDYFKETKFSWGGRTWRTHNHVLTSYDGADGMKTGYTRASGFNLMTSARRHGVRVVAVVMGGRTASRRDKDMARILDLNYRRIAANPKYKARRLASLPTPVLRPGSASERSQSVQVAAADAPLPFPAPLPLSAPMPDQDDGPDDAGAVPTPMVFAANDADLSENPAGSSLTLDVLPAPRSADNTSTPSGNNDTTGDDTMGDDTMGEVDAIGREISRALTFPVALRTRTGEDDPERAPDLTDENGITDDIGKDEDAATAVAALTDADMAASLAASLADEGVMGEGDGRPSAHFEELAELAARAAGRRGPAQIGIQVGAFLRLSTATRYLENAMAVVPAVLKQDNAAIVQSDTESGPIFRARFGPFSAQDAEEACGLLEAKGMDCFAVEDNAWDRAIRPN